MRHRSIFTFLAATIGCALLLIAPHAALAFSSCTTGQTTCTFDTTNDQTGNPNVAGTLSNGGVLERIWFLAIQQCQAFVYPETIGSTINSIVITQPIHLARVGFCNNIASQGPTSVLGQAIAAYVMNLTVEGELLAGSGPGGNMVDADINAALAVMMEVQGGSSVSTTGTASSGSEAVTVASGTSIQAGQNVYCAGCAAGATVTYISGTTVMLSQPLSAALSATTMAFVNPLTGPAVGNF